ncbi:RICIN domain-containing protein [Candidatus Sumerlaeota bacterium]|nr:RICIN domain-containing protein [Candidatus Sumerlaeota bacterium]
MHTFLSNSFQRNRASLLAILTVLLALALHTSSHAQDHVVAFSATAPGEDKAITNWGLDTCWADVNNMRRGLIFMGPETVNLVRVGFVVDEPIINYELSDKQKEALQRFADIAALAGPDARWDMNWASELHPWYREDRNVPFHVIPERWAEAIIACQRYYNRPIWSVEGYNEPDNPYLSAGSPKELYEIFGILQEAPEFQGALMAGGSTLNCDPGLSWFHAVATRAKIGTIHCLAGTAENYINFIKGVKDWGAAPYNPEAHNVVEVIIGAEYGLEGCIWWGTAELARGEFAKACQGKRLGYAENLENWTAAAVYRAPSGKIQAFLGGVERMATTTTFRFVCEDRDVFFDGHGPQRVYDVTVPGAPGYQTDQPNSEKVINITWGDDVEPPIDGRYIVVNRNSGLALEVKDAGTTNGTALQQAAYTGAPHQQWDVNPLPLRAFQDRSYFNFKAAHCGTTADLNNWSHDNGAKVQLWGDGRSALQQWYLQYTGDGYFKICSKWSGKVMTVSGASKENGAQVVQWEDDGSPAQEWRLIPATIPAYDFDAPEAPAGLEATANALSVTLNWKANSDSDLANYTVLRSTAADGPYEIIARGLTAASFTDNSAAQNTDYYYIVKAVDQSLNQSDFSNQATATPAGSTGLVAQYNFDGDTNDSTVNANHAAITSAAAFDAGRAGEQAIVLDGSSNYLTLPPTVAGFDELTVAAWIYWNGGDSWQRIFDFGNGTSEYLFLSPKSGDGDLRLAVKNGGPEQQLKAAVLPVDRWLHVAVTLGGHTAALYVDGVCVADTDSITIKPSDIKPALNLIGDSQFGQDPHFNGKLDDFRIYNYALSADEVAELAGIEPPAAAPADR